MEQIRPTTDTTREVLVVEDDPAMAAALRHGFAGEGFDVAVVGDGVAGLERATERPPDIMILDVMLPRLNGLDVCRRLRADGSPLPIIMLTARGQEGDRVAGLRTGADDYVTKPFSFLELVARVEAVLRRADPGGPATERVELGDVTVDFRRHEATKAGRPVALCPREFQLLAYLHRRRGEVVSRRELLEAVWGYQTTLTRTVDTHVAKLRKKLEDRPSDPRFILTVHRVGYRLAGSRERG